MREVRSFEAKTHLASFLEAANAAHRIRDLRKRAGSLSSADITEARFWPPMSFVVHCSVAMAWVLQDKVSGYADAALEQVVRDNATIPDLWWLETRNVLLIAERRNRISPEDANTADKALTDLGLIQDGGSDRQEVLRIARKHDLTSYDAIYLETALRR